MPANLRVVMCAAVLAASLCGVAQNRTRTCRIDTFPIDPPAAGTVREIEDPHSGKLWLLLRANGTPGGPGRLVELQPDTPDGSAQTGSDELKSSLPLIRAGDHVLAERRTPVSETVLRAVALGTARAGSPLRVRLDAGGSIRCAIAVAPGRVTLAATAEANGCGGC